MTSVNSGHCRQCHIQVEPVDNVSVAVEIASFSRVVQKLFPLPFQLPPYWISGRRMTSDFLGDGIVENTDPENGGGVGRHRVCVSSWSLGDVRGGGCKLSN